MTRRRMRPFLLASFLTALLAFGCGSGNEYPPLPKFDVPKPVEAKTTPQGKKVTKPPLAPMKSPAKPN